ncbi:P-selectin-like [Chanodichthys erythropterus]|uniref:P-selectin-like n=1 Tax=Chanodichthys erythropterus TaxID=933992 RepID=UPI00351DBFED
MLSILLAVLGLLSFTSSQISHQYHFINISKNWTEAQRFCREKYTDLATVNNADEMNSLFRTISDVSYDVYIGLYRSEVFRWHWTLPDSYNVKSYQNWKDKQPNKNNNEGCAAMNKNGKWFNDSCDSQRPFVCFNDNLILVRENLTWTEAVSYCRKHHVDLVSIHSEELQKRAMRRASQASTSHVWLGLRYTCTFNFWFWIKNRETGCYQNWASGHGHNYEECGLSGAMESTGGHHWVGRPESERLNFICQLCADTL